MSEAVKYDPITKKALAPIIQRTASDDSEVWKVLVVEHAKIYTRSLHSEEGALEQANTWLKTVYDLWQGKRNEQS